MTMLTKHLSQFALLTTMMAAVAAGQQTTTVTVPSTQAWTRTGIYLNPGSEVRIQAKGEIEAVSDADTRPLFHHVPPAGRPERQANKPQPQMPALVMLARIGNGPVLEAGANSQFVAGGQTGTGELMLGINDDYVADNTGVWTAQITVNNNAVSDTSNRRAAQNYPNSPAPQQNGRVQSNDRYQNQNDRYPDDSQSNNRRVPLNGRNTSIDARAADVAMDEEAQQVGRSALGLPIGGSRITEDGRGRVRDYRNGSVFWTAETGAHAVLGQIREEWLNHGAESGELGYPVTSETRGRDGISRVMRFERGTITWNQRNGAVVDRR